LAKQGEVAAHFNLGDMHAYEIGVPENDVEAYVWFSVAAAQEHENTKSSRDIVSKRPTTRLTRKRPRNSCQVFQV
jgi:TPR repeat protein